MTRKLVRLDRSLNRLPHNKANFDVLKGLFSELLREYDKVKQILKGEGGKFKCVDVLAENKKSELVIVKIQNTCNANHFQHMLCGTAKVIIEHIAEEQPYYLEINKAYSVSIVYFDFDRGNDYIYDGTTPFIGPHSRTEQALSVWQWERFWKSSISEFHPGCYIIKLNRFDKVTRDTSDEWIYFLKTAEIKEEFTAKWPTAASPKLDLLQLDPADRKAYECYLEAQCDDASFVQIMRVEVEAAVKEATKEAEEEVAAREKSKITEQALRESATVAFAVAITGPYIQQVQTIADKPILEETLAVQERYLR